MTRSELFKNLMVLAAADGKMTEEEVAFLAQRSARWGVTDAEFAEAMKFAVSPEAVISIPATRGERQQLLQEMLRMMAVDGNLSDIEKNLFAVAAATMRINDDELNQIFDDVLTPRKS